MREKFERKLLDLRDDILKMGSRVDEELQLALQAFNEQDVDLAHRVHQVDKEVNAMRFAIEEKCLTLIATQQPAASDLRIIVAVMNMIVDLERMGDQAKGIAKVIPHMVTVPPQPQPLELGKMGELVATMLIDVMDAYANNDIQLAQEVGDRDTEVDKLFAKVFHQIMHQMADTKNPDKVETNYELIRVARELERFGDLATNIGERIIYQVTGSFDEINIDDEN